MNLSNEALQNVVTYIERTDSLLNSVAMQKQAAAQRIPEVVEALIKRGFIVPEQRARAIAALQDPLKALESLRKTAEAAFVPPPTLGTPATEKKANGEKLSAADAAFLRGLGLR